MSDRLALAHAFEDAGIVREKAEQLATAVLAAIRDNVATKSDLRLAIAELERRLLVRGLTALAAGLSALFAAPHLWPAH